MVSASPAAIAVVPVVTSLFHELSFLSVLHIPYQKLALSRGRRRRRSYRRGKLGETDSRSSRLRGSMLLPNSTESETESAEAKWTSYSIRPALRG